MDRWGSLPIVLGGGLDLSTDALTLGTVGLGYAIQLQNYEPSIEGGYKRILGYSKYDTNVVPGVANSPILGCFVALSGVFGARKNSGSTGVDIYYSTGSGWGSKINTSSLNVNTTKIRAAIYSFTQPIIVFVNGLNYALKYNGSADTVINGAGAPTAPKYAVGLKNRLVLAPGSNNSSIVLSSPYDDTDFTAAKGAIEINVGDTVKGLAAFRDTLYIFCENSIHKLVGNTSADFTVVPVTHQIGCISHDSIQEVGGDIIFLAPDGFRSIAATERIGDVNLGLLSKRIQPLVRSSILGQNEDKYVCLPIRQKSQYRCFVNSSATDSTNTIGVIGKLEEREGLVYSWSTTYGIHAYSGHSAYSGTSEIAVIGAISSGFVFRLESGNSFNTVNIPYVYQSPFITFEDTTLRKVLYKMDLYTEIEGPIQANLNIIYDYNNTGIHQPPSVMITETGSFSLYGTALYGTATYSGVANPVFKKNLVGSGFVSSVKISGSDTNAPHRLDSYILQFGKHGRR